MASGRSRKTSRRIEPDRQRRLRRELLLERLEERRVMAVGPQLAGIQPNVGELLENGDVRNVAPRELVFHFSGQDPIDAATLSGIRLTRSGGDGQFERAAVHSDFNSNGAVVLEFTANHAGRGGNDIQLIVRKRDLGLAVQPLISVDGKTITAELNTRTGSLSRAQDLVAAINGNARSRALVLASVRSGNAQTDITTPAITYSPLALGGTNAAKARTNFNAPTPLEVQFTATTAGLSGNGIRLEFTRRDLGFGAPIVAVNGRTIQITLNSNVTRPTTAQQLVDTLNNHVQASALVVSSIPVGQPSTVIGSTTLIGPLTLNGANDIEIEPGLLALGDSPRDVVMRFASTLPDEFYRVDILGSGALALKDDKADLFGDTSDDGVDFGQDFEMEFELDLGAQVVAIVPQPITRNGTSNALSQLGSRIEVYFNDDDLNDASAQTPGFYQLIYTNNTIDPTDDQTFVPIDVQYDSGTDRALLTFARSLESLPNGGPVAGTFRLRVGTNEARPALPVELSPTTDPGSSFATAHALGTLVTEAETVTQSRIITSAIDRQPFALDLPGASDEPGHRDLRPEIQQHLLRASDAEDGPAIQPYNFAAVYTDTFGNTLLNAITDEQKHLARQVFSLYSRYLGLQFVETENLGFTIVTGDLRAIEPTVATGPGGVLGLAGRNMAIMDAGEIWTNSFGDLWFQTAMKQVGRLLGLGPTDELPPPTIANSSPGLAFDNTPEPVFPGDHDIVHGQHLYRPDGTDIDLYSFTVAKEGVLNVETIAERAATPSLLDTFLRLYRETRDEQGNLVRELVAQNDDFFSKDSRIELTLSPGTYYLGVSAAGNDQYDPIVAGTGYGGRSVGTYELRASFRPRTTLPATLAMSGGAVFVDGSILTVRDSRGVARSFEVEKAGGRRDPDSVLVPLTNEMSAAQVAAEFAARFAQSGLQITSQQIDNRLRMTGLAADDGVNRPFRLSAGFQGVQISPDASIQSLVDDAGSLAITGGGAQILDGSIITITDSRDGSQLFEFDKDGVQRNFGTRLVRIRDDMTANQVAAELAREINRGGLTVTAQDVGNRIRIEGLFPEESRAIRLSPGFVGAVPFPAAQALDGDGDGVPGGVFDYWFNVAPASTGNNAVARTIYVDKAAAVGGNGTLAAPFRELDDAIRNASPNVADPPRVVIRAVGNGGADRDLATLADNVAYEVGFRANGQVLNDGANVEVPRNATLVFDAGAIVKSFRGYFGVGSSTDALDRSGGAIQVLGVPRWVDTNGAVRRDAANLPIPGSVYFTSTQDTIGTDTDNSTATASPGDWGGLVLRSELDFRAVREDLESAGVFPNFVAQADMRYGGGIVVIDGLPVSVAPIELVETRPTLIHNTITRSANAAISADPESFEETTFNTPQFQAVRRFTADYDRRGPELYGNVLATKDASGNVSKNAIGGLFVRVRTLAGNETDTLDVAARWDDNDIPHIVTETLVITGGAGGPVLDEDTPATALVTVTPSAGGSLVPGVYNYRLTFVDASNAEGPPSNATANVTLAPGQGTAVLNQLPAAPSGYTRRLYRSTNAGIAPYVRVAELDASSTLYIDAGETARNEQSGVLDVAFTKLRARQSGRLMIDPSTVVKLRGSRIDASMGARIDAEGHQGQEIVFTSLQDDRFGGAGTFDTNNDDPATSSGTESAGAAGDWSGLYLGPASGGSLDHAIVSFGGGLSAVEGLFTGFNAIEVRQADVRIANSEIRNNADGLGGQAPADRYGRGEHAEASIFVRGAQPVIVDNVIRDNAGAAVSIDVNSLNFRVRPDQGRSTYGAALRSDGAPPLDRDATHDDNRGPLLDGNRMTANGVSGLRVRGGTLTTEGVWDDTDIVHVVRNETIYIPDFHSYGGLRIESSPDESLVVKLDGQRAGFTALGRPLDIEDRVGGAVQVIGQPGAPVLMTSTNDCTVGAGLTPDGSPLTDTLSSGLCGGQQIGGGTSGAVLIDGGDRDDFGHGFADPGPDNIPGTMDDINQDGWLFIEQMIEFAMNGNLNNAPNDVLVIGADPSGGFFGSPALEAITSVTTVLGLGMTVVNDAQITSVAFNDYKVIYVPSDLNTFGGIDDNEIALLTARKTEIQQFVNSGGSLVALTEAFSVTPYSWLELPLPFVIDTNIPFFCFNCLRKTQAAIDAGFTISDAELSNGTPYHNTFTGPPGFNGLVPFVMDSGFDDIPGNADDGVVTLGLASGSFGIGVSNPGQPGDWRSIRLEPYSSDRNVDVAIERETPHGDKPRPNGTIAAAEILGEIGPNQKSGDENRRLGFVVHGELSAPGDVDVYSFKSIPLTEVWLDIDKTSSSLDTVVELLDATGTVLARSDNSYAESRGTESLFIGPGLQRYQVGTLDKSPFEGLDRWSTNPRDAGLRVVLPGVRGTTPNDYFVRVRSSQPAPGLSDPNRVNAGLTKGAYELQVRLREQDEFAGSTVRYADLRFGEAGIEVIGVPRSSPLLGEAAEPLRGPNQAENHETLATALELGNILATDKSALSVAGALVSNTDVDFYRFEAGYTSLDTTQPQRNHVGLTFDIDYADGLARPNTSLWVFDQNGNLILSGRDSSVNDDRAIPLSGANLDDLSRGSAGPLDPYIGPVELPAAITDEFYTAVTSNGFMPSELQQFTTGRPTNPADTVVRAEPIDSLRRIADDSISPLGLLDANGLPITSTGQGLSRQAVPPTVPVLLDDSSVVPFSLGDVTLFVVRDPLDSTTTPDNRTVLLGVNPFTGQTTNTYGIFAQEINDIAFHPTLGDLRAFGYQELATASTDANSDDYLRIDPRNAATALSAAAGNHLITTFQEVVAMPGTDAASNRGVIVDALTLGPHRDALRGFLVGHRGDTLPPPGVVATQNLLYQFDPGTGAATSVPDTNRASPTRYQGAGTQIVERAALNTLVDQNAPADARDTALIIPSSVADGDKFVLDEDGNPQQPIVFEFNTGPLVQFAVPAAATRNLRDGQWFSLDGIEYEFDTGPVIVTQAGASISDGVQFTVTDNAFPPRTIVFEFELAGGVAPNATPVPITAALSANAVATAVATAVNAAFPANVAAQANVNVVTIRGDTGINIPSPQGALLVGLRSEGDYGPQRTNAIAIPVEENFTLVEFVTAMQTTFTPNLGVAGNLMNFSNATLGDFTNAPIFTAQSADGRIANPGANGIRFRINQTPPELAVVAATAISNFFSLQNPGSPTQAAVASQNVVTLIEGSSFRAHDPMTLPTTDPQFIVAPATGGGGNISGMAFLDGRLWTITDKGELFVVNNPTGEETFLDVNGIAVRVPTGLDYIGQLLDNAGRPIVFTGLAAGPPNADGGRYAHSFFGIDAAGTLWAFGTDAQFEPVFVNGAHSVATGIAGAQGLQFSNLDVNLWHRTLNRTADDGHGVRAAFDESRPVEDLAQNASFWFGYENATVQPQLGTTASFTAPAAATFANTYDFAGGAHGSLLSKPFSLEGYSTQDEPTLYFSYRLETEGANAADPTRDPFMVDAFRVYITGADGQWKLLSTNNSATAANDRNDEFDLFRDPLTGLVDQPFSRATTFDINETATGGLVPASWRQARVALGPYAGRADLRLRFEFSTAGSVNVGDVRTTGSQLRAVSADKLRDGDRFRVGGVDFEFDLGNVVNAPVGAAIRDQATFTLVGANGPLATLEFDTNGSSAPTNVAVAVGANLTASEVARAIADAVNARVAGVTATQVGTRVELTDVEEVIASLNLPSGFVDGILGVGNATAVPVRPQMSAVEVAQSVARALSTTFAVAPSGTAREVEPNETLATAQPTDSESWSAAPNDNITDAQGARLDVAHITLRGSGDGTVDRYAFTVSAANERGTFDIDATSASLDTIVRLFDANGNVLPTGENDNGSNATLDSGSLNSRDSFLEFTFNDPGLYYVEVSQSVNGTPTGLPSGTSYQLHIALEQHAEVRNAGATFRTYDEFVNVIGQTVQQGGPLGVVNRLFGDAFGAFSASTNPDGTTSNANPGVLGAQRNRFEGVYLDDLIIGFAERGEMYLRSQAAAVAARTPAFVANPLQPANEIAIGPYQLEVRRSEEYGVSGDPLPLPTLCLRRGDGCETNRDGRAFDTNDRLGQFVSLEVPSGRDLPHGATFSISDGVQQVTFEFRDVTSEDATLGNPPLGQGRIRIEFRPTETAATIARRVRDIVNGNEVRSRLAVAAVTADGRASDPNAVGTSDRVDLIGNVVVDVPRVSEPSDTLRNAVPTGIRPNSGSIYRAQAEIGDNLDLSGANDVDLYRLDLRAGESYAVDIDAAVLGSGLDTIVRVFDAAGTQLVSSDDNPAPDEAPSDDSFVTFVAPADGTYYVGVSSFANISYNPNVANSAAANLPGLTSGFYELEIRPAAATPVIEGTATTNDTLLTATLVTALDGTGQVARLRGSIGDNPSQATTADVDLVRFDLAAGERITIDSDSPGNSPLDSVVRVFDASGVQLAISDDAAAPDEPFSFDSFLTFVAPARGTYYVGVSSSGNATYDPRFVSLLAAGRTLGEYELEIRRDIAQFDARNVREQVFDLRGDANVPREQGQIVIANNLISDTRTWGVLVDAGARDGLGNLPHPGPARVTREVNVQNIAPGVVVENNVLANNGTGGILFSGDMPTIGDIVGAVPVGRINNNTIVSDGGGIGIQVTENASPTLLNNIVSGLDTGIDVDASSASTVIVGTLYQGNANNISGTTSGLGSFAINLTNATDPLFVDAEAGNYYLAPGSQAIDSSVESVPDRAEFLRLRAPLGIPVSPIIAPDYDVLGQRRVDDRAVGTPPGIGQIVFKDRGAIDRADFAGPTALLVSPRDNDGEGLDVDSRTSFVKRVAGSLSEFAIQLVDGLEPTDPANGVGADDSSVLTSSVTVFENGRRLTRNVDYRYSYDQHANILHITPIAGVWKPDVPYVLEVANGNRFIITAPAGNLLNDDDPLGTPADADAFGDQFTVRSLGTNAADFTFEFESGYSIQLPQTLSLLVPREAGGAGGLADGQRFSVDDGTTVVTFEFDENNAIGSGNTRIPYSRTDSVDVIANNIVTVLNRANLGLTPSNRGNGKIHLGAGPNHIVDVTNSRLTTTGSTTGITDGETFTIDDGTKFVTFEFDRDNTLTTQGNVRIRVLASDTHEDIADKVVAAIVSQNLGLTPQHFRVLPTTRFRLGGYIHLGGQERHVLDTTNAPSLAVEGKPGVQPVFGMRLATRAGRPINITDGDTFVLGNGTRNVTFEFDSNGIATPGNLVVRYVVSTTTGAITSTTNQIADAIVSAVREASLGLSPVNLGGGIINLGGTANHVLTVTAAPALTQRGVPGGAAAIPVAFIPDETYTDALVAQSIATVISQNVPQAVTTLRPDPLTDDEVIVTNVSNISGVNSRFETGITDLARNVLKPNQTDGSVRFTVLVVGGEGGQDFGDAPIGPTLLAAGGARHTIVNGYRLGARIDLNVDGQPTSGADGDDLDGDVSDEDGVTFPVATVNGVPSNALIRTFGNQITIAAAGITAQRAGYVDAWIDYDQNGTWSAEEQILVAQQIANPTGAATVQANFTISVPTTAVVGATYARFRYSSTGGLQPGGEASDGEVEDYLVRIVSSPWQNAVTPEDTNADGSVSPIDALLIINHLQFNGSHPLPNPPPAPPAAMFDVDGNSSVTPLDVLLVIRKLNEQLARRNSVPAEGEPTSSAVPLDATALGTSLLATGSFVPDASWVAEVRRRAQSPSYMTQASSPAPTIPVPSDKLGSSSFAWRPGTEFDDILNDLASSDELPDSLLARDEVFARI